MGDKKVSQSTKKLQLSFIKIRTFIYALIIISKLT